MASLLKQKKGSSLDLFYIVVGIFAVAIIGILISSVITRFNTEFQKIVIPNMGTEAKAASSTLGSIFPNTLNGGILFLFFAACAVALILASMTPMHPVFFIFYILELVLLIIFGAGIANAFQGFIETPALATEFSQYTLIIYLFRYLPYVIGVIGFILAAIMYKVRQGQQDGF